ncbi:MAG: hypothetical protein JXM70_13580 [Pirellulales bacterium]|nr:hypothetical protein [Pirellulales bacterium]
MRKAMVIMVLALAMGNFLAVGAGAAPPLIKDLPLEVVYAAKDTVTIATQDKPAVYSLELPSFPKREGHVLCLRFEAFLHHPTPGGWNPYLGLMLNGKKLAKFTGFGEYRMLKRGDFCKTTIAADKGWWDSRAGMPVLLAFFGPGGDVLDERVISQRDEGYWYILDISDTANFIEMGADDRIESEKPNKLTFVNTFTRKLVPGAKHYSPMVIRDIQIGYLPKALVAKSRPSTMLKFDPITSGAQLAPDGAALRISPTGGMQVRVGGDDYFICSEFSYPGEKMGYNTLMPHKADGQTSWKPEVQQEDGSIVLTAKAEGYELRRTIKADGCKVKVHDTITNTSAEPTAVVVKHTIAATRPIARGDFRVAGTDREAIIGGLAQNPTLFVRQKGSSLGVLAEDNVLRRQLEVARRGNSFSFATRHFGLKPREKYCLQWTLYPSAGRDYFDFINQVRRDWGVNFTIKGPYVFSDKYIPQRKANIYAFGPWFDYHHDGSQTWDSYRKKITPMLTALRKKQPDAVLMPLLETNLYTMAKSKIKGGDILPGSDRKKGKYGYILNQEQSKVLKAVLGEWADSVLRTADGRIVVDTYYPGYQSNKEDLFNLMLYLRKGNYRHRHFIKQIDYLMDEIGFNGIYIDQFSLCGGYGRPDAFTYDKWDGRTVDIDDGGHITRMFTDCNLVGADARADIIKHILAKGGHVVINGQSTVRETRSLAAFRFQEMDNDGVNPLNFMDGKPPIFYWQAMGHLGSPIILGLRPVRYGEEGKQRWAEIITKGIITALRNGVLYYYYTSSIPASGPGAGEYGPVNHMFPFTPVELHEGWLVGRERTITCVSGVYKWAEAREPKCLLFDLHGRVKPGDFVLKRVGDGWEVTVKLDDWNEIAVIE